MINYYSTFKNIQNQQILVDIYVPNQNNDDIKINLSDNPVIITQNSNGLFSPIKSTSCTINIMTEVALWDLYTTDPQSIMVVVNNVTTGKMLFQGYATPCQYGQDWTTIDVLSLECVDMLSSLKGIPYSPFRYPKGYIPVDQLISYLIARTIGDSYDQLYHNISWYWPKYNFKRGNGYILNTTTDFIHAIKLDENNFFDDDDEETPWTCYEVLEEVCKYFGVSAVPYQGSVYFIDYLYVAGTGSHDGVGFGMYDFWKYSLDMDVSSTAVGKGLTISKNDYSSGTTTIGTDDFYNVISISANRYDIDEVVPDVYDDDKHNSITKEHNFGGPGVVWDTQQVNDFWINGGGSTLASCYVFTQYCYMKNNTGWVHKWWNPQTLQQVSNYYSPEMDAITFYNNTPENKYINTIGATILHYCALDSIKAKPTSLDWKDVIMFNCFTDTVQSPSMNISHYISGEDLRQWYNVYEKPVLEYTSDYALNFSPKQGKSWIVINGALWYQNRLPREFDQNQSGDIYPITETKNHKQMMFPVEDVTNKDPYYGRVFYENPNGSQGSINVIWRHSEQWANQNEWGWKLMCFKLQIGDKYWNGTQWTTTDSKFYIDFTAQGDEGYEDSFMYLKWMNIVTNTNYQDKVGTDGYAIPIAPEDCINGQLTLTLYTPRPIPANNGLPTNFLQTDWLWYTFAPVVFMKDFKVDYVYTDATEFWLLPTDEKEDIKYSNDWTKEGYKYEKEEEFKINSWQENRPIAKSFPIINFTGDGTNNTLSGVEICEFLSTMTDQSYTTYEAKQEENIINRYLRHYKAPRKTAQIHRKEQMNPWSRATFNNSAQLTGTFVVDRQEFNVRECNCTVDLVEYGDASFT